MSSTNKNTSRQLSRGLSIMQWGLVVLMISSAVQADQRFCGKQLVAMLSMVCEEFPDLHYGIKKSMIDFDKMDYSSDEWMTMMNQDQQDSMVSNELMIPSNHVVTDQQQQKVPIWMTMMYPQNYPFRTASGRNELIPPRFRKSPRGIVDECCLRPCGMNQLLKYCKTAA